MGNEPGIYGLRQCNRDDLWGKNCFNSNFPVGLANYMRDNNIEANYITLDKHLNIKITGISIDEMYNAGGTPNEDLYFSFETVFDPYERYSYSSIPPIDLVVKKEGEGFLRPLEVKLTVIPDNSTCDGPEEEWGTEIVFRPPTVQYCAIGMMDSCRDELNEVREIFEPVGSGIENWENSTEMLQNLPVLAEAINDFERQFFMKQRPLVMQPVWKTEGKSPIICDDAFDIFVWSDYAFTRLFMSSVDKATPFTKISRQNRSALRLARCFYEISKSGKVNLDSVFSKMTFNLQTDKEFSSNGHVTRHYMNCPRFRKPAVKKDAVQDIILNGGEKFLSPERRFDQSVYYTMYDGWRR